MTITTPIAVALKELFYLGLSRTRSSCGYVKPLLDPGGGFTSASETAIGRYAAASEAKRLQIYNGYM
jgi:hypothetical protein